MYPGYYKQEQLLSMLAESMCPEKTGSNALYRQERAREANFYLHRKLWKRYIQAFHPRHWASVLLSLQGEIPVSTFLEIASEIWNSPQYDFLPCDFLFQATIGTDVEFCRSHLMDCVEKELYENLPESLVLFRSHSSYNRLNLSWTPDLESAISIKSILNYEYISKTVLHKRQFAALFARRRFREVIISSQAIPHLIVDQLDSSPEEEPSPDKSEE